ncbi:MAG: L-rhamnose isomerase [Oscillospiraceae bacterium]|nr:L-rhamnose isomerase [Oscillospiraceae bacterium]
MRQEALKTLPFGAVWEEFCARNAVPGDEDWLPIVQQYEQDVTLARG